MNPVVKKIGSNTGIFFSGALGYMAASAGLPMIPKFGPVWFQKLFPGLASIVLAGLIAGKFTKDDVVQTGMRGAAFGLGLAGVGDLLAKFVGPSVPFVQKNAPNLSGMGYVQNYGSYPPSYFTKSMQGLGNTAYALQGMGNTAYALQGMGNTAYALQGLPVQRMLVGQ